MTAEPIGRIRPGITSTRIKGWLWQGLLLFCVVVVAWFFGHNALGVPVYDKVTGGCRDGLHIDRLNENQGAESTLSLLQSLLEVKQFAREYQDELRTNGRKPAPVLIVATSKTTR